MELSKSKLWISTIGVAAFIVSASNAQEQPGAAASGELQGKADQIQAEVAELRGLPFKHRVKAEVQPIKEFGEYLDKSLEAGEGTERLKYYGKIVKKLGLYSGPVINDASGMMKMVMTSQAAAYYDPEKQTFFVLMTKMPELVLGSFFAHELYHGLQDQHFDLNKYLLHPARQRTLNADEILARQSVVEGEATYMMTLWMLKRVTGSVPQREMLSPAINMQASMDMEMLRSTMKQPQVAEMMGEDMVTAVAAIDKIPPFMFDMLIGAYMKGAGFVFSVEEKGWPEIEKLYGSAPPASMEQILHPEKWFARELPTKIQLPALTDRAVRDFELLDADVLGEFSWRSIFKAQGLASEANALAAGWDGDRYAVLKRKGADDLLLLLYTSWDSEQDAGKFVEGYTRALTAKYAGGKEPTRVVQKGKSVLIAEGGSEAGIDSLVDWLAKSKLTKAQ